VTAHTAFTFQFTFPDAPCVLFHGYPRVSPAVIHIWLLQSHKKFPMLNNQYSISTINAALAELVEA